MRRYYSKFLINLIIAVFLEVIVFNITSYRVLLGNFEKKEFNQFEFVQCEGSKVILKIDNINREIATIKVNFSDSLEEVTEYRVYFSDETSSGYRGLNLKRYVPENEKSKFMPLYLSGKVNGIQVEIDKEIYKNNQLDSIIINSKIPFNFNIIRFVIILGILTIRYILKYEENINQEYSPKNLTQELVLLFVIAIFFVISLFINQNSIEPDSHRVYNEKFVNSVYHGTFALEDKPSKAFIDLENPYDDLERSKLERGKDYLWDTAYYKGNYYVYFGILPLLVFFLPYYVITKKYLDMAIVIFILSMIIFIFIKEILLKIVNRYFDKIQFKFILYSLIMLCSGSLILYADGMSRFYELAVLSGLACVLVGIYFILNSLEKENKKYTNIFWGCTFLALSVACRPTELFASLLILPYLIKTLYNNIKVFNKDKKPLFKLIISCRNSIYYNWNFINDI